MPRGIVRENKSDFAKADCSFKFFLLATCVVGIVGIIRYNGHSLCSVQPVYFDVVGSNILIIKLR